jgi:WD40 repeat protein
VTGVIADHHRDLNGATGRLGFPLCSRVKAQPSPLGTLGYWQRFEGSFDYSANLCDRLELRCGATVYHSPATGTHATWGGIGEFYERGGATASRLGFPATDECEVVSRQGTRGWFQRFESGVVYFTKRSGARVLDPNLADCHDRHGGVDGRLGFPVGPEREAATSPAGTVGRVQRFEGPHGGAAIYISEPHGGHPVWAGIGTLYELLDGPKSWLGYPTSSEVDARVSDEEWCCHQSFEGGTVFWKKACGAVAVPVTTMRILSDDRWLARHLGFPTAGERALSPGETIQFFEHGVVTVRDGTAQAWVRPSSTTPAPLPAGPRAEPTGVTVVRSSLDGHLGGYDVAFSPDTRLIATARGKDGVELRNRRTNERTDVLLPGHEDFLTHLAFRADGRMLAAGGVDGTVWLWDTVTGDHAGGPLTGSAGSVNALTFSPRGNLAIARGRAPQRTGEVQIWDPATALDHVDPVVSPEANVMSLAFSPDSRKLAVGLQDGTVRLDHAKNGPGDALLTGHEGFVTALAFSPDSRTLATGDHHGTVRLWDMRRNTLIGDPLTGHDRAVDELTFSPDGRLLVSVGRDRALRFWDPVIGHAIGEPFTEHGGYAHALTFRPDRSMLAIVTPVRTEDGQDTVGTTEICRIPLGRALQAQVKLLHDRLDG